METEVNSILTSEKFFKAIEEIIKKSGRTISLIDAVVYYAEKNNLEIETLAALIKNNAKYKLAIQCEGEELKFLPSRARLPV